MMMNVKFKIPIFFPTILAGLVIFLVFYGTPESGFVSALKINKECYRESPIERENCLGQAIEKRASEDPGSVKALSSGFWELLEEGKIHDDPRLFSPIVHEIGMTYIRGGLSVQEALASCSSDFRGGCIHGVIMEYLEKESIEPVEFLPFCNSLKEKETLKEDEYRNCIHAIGHMFTAVTQGSLTNGLMQCQNVPERYEETCLSGVFMEYSTGEFGQGYHSHKPVGSIELPCDTLPLLFKDSCYISAGFYRQYEIESESWEQSYHYCTGVPERYQNSCIAGVGSAFLFVHTYDTQKALSACALFEGNSQNICVSSVELAQEL